jgi:hypothetical protein
MLFACFWSDKKSISKTYTQFYADRQVLSIRDCSGSVLVLTYYSYVTILTLMVVRENEK